MRLLVGPVGRECVEGIGDRDDARQGWNLLALESMRIPAAVEGFVVQFDAWNHLLELRNRTQNVCALGGMRLHDVKFFGGQCTWFSQYPVFNANLAYVMQLG